MRDRRRETYATRIADLEAATDAEMFDINVRALVAVPHDGTEATAEDVAKQLVRPYGKAGTHQNQGQAIVCYGPDSNRSSTAGNRLRRLLGRQRPPTMASLIRTQTPRYTRTWTHVGLVRAKRRANWPLDSDELPRVLAMGGHPDSTAKAGLDYTPKDSTPDGSLTTTNSPYTGNRDLLDPSDPQH